MAPAPMPWATRATDEHAHRRRQAPDAGGRPRTAPGRRGTAPRCPAGRPPGPASTMPRRLPRKNPLNTQPYSPSPPRSSATTGITVEMASASKATSVIVRTSPSVSRRRSGAQTPSARAGLAERERVVERSRPACCHRRDGPPQDIGRRTRFVLRRWTYGWHADRRMAAVARAGPDRPPALQRGPGHRAVRAARPGHQPGPARRWCGRSTSSTPRCSGSRGTARASPSGPTTVAAPIASGPRPPAGSTPSRRRGSTGCGACDLFVYRFDPDAVRAVARGRRLLDVADGGARRSPSSPMGDLLERHADAGIELRIVSSLRPAARRRCSTSGYRFSMARMANAADVRRSVLLGAQRREEDDVADRRACR